MRQLLTSYMACSKQGLLDLFENNIKMQNNSWLDISGQFILPADQRGKQGNIFLALLGSGWPLAGIIVLSIGLA